MDLTKVFIEKLVYPGMERVKGNRVRCKTAELIDAQSQSPALTALSREEKLRRLLLTCIDHVPVYRPYRGLRPFIERDPLAALSRFSLLNKEDFRRDSDSYINEKADLSSLIKNHTGGSSGQPLHFYMDRPAVESYEAARWRGLSWWGITPGMRSVMIWGNASDACAATSMAGHFKERFLKNRMVIPAYDLSPEKMQDYFKRVVRFAPRYFYGYASALYTFASIMRSLKLQLPFVPLAVVSTSEVLHDYQRAVIEEAFGCRAVNEYGARDAGILAFECPEGGMHLTTENFVLELVHPVTLKPVPPGQSGLVVVTDLNNFSMPRLRYVLGDMAVLSDTPCSCGRTMPLLSDISGRQTDMFLLPNGTLLHGSVFNALAVVCPAIRQFLIVQKSVEQAQLFIVRAENAEEAALEQFISDVRKRLPEVHVAVSFPEEIAPLKSGKFSYAIREFDLR